MTLLILRNESINKKYGRVRTGAQLGPPTIYDDFKFASDFPRSKLFYFISAQPFTSVYEVNGELIYSPLRWRLLPRLHIWLKFFTLTPYLFYYLMDLLQTWNRCFLSLPTSFDTRPITLDPIFYEVSTLFNLEYLVKSFCVEKYFYCIFKVPWWIHFKL